MVRYDHLQAAGNNGSAEISGYLVWKIRAMSD